MTITNGHDPAGTSEFQRLLLNSMLQELYGRPPIPREKWISHPGMINAVRTLRERLARIEEDENG